MTIYRRWLVVLIAACLGGLAAAPAARAQAPRDVRIRAAQHWRPLDLDRGAPALWQTLKKLNTRASLLMFTAHPDDEDGGLLAYESRGQGAGAALVTINRGESGQNVMSNDYFDALGLVRTQELLAADRYYGVQQYFTRFIDFGFSKSKAQALGKWGFNNVLRDEVRVVRMVHPLVVMSVFVGGPSDGHGHHQTAGEMAQEVYKYAGDPKMFPDQIKAGLQPWTPLKVYARVPVYAVSSKGIFDYADQHYYPVRFHNYVTGAWINHLPSTQVEVPEGTFAPMLGAAYNQISRKGLGFQKTQNGGPSIPQLGPSATPYHLWASRVKTPGENGGKEDSFFQGIDTSLMGIASLAPAADAALLRPGLRSMSDAAQQAMRDFSAEHPERIAPLLAQGLSAANQLIQQVENSPIPTDAKQDVLFELKVKQAQFNTALSEALGLHVDAVVAPPASGGRGDLGARSGVQPTFQMAIPGQKFQVQVHVANTGADPVQVSRLEVTGPATEHWTVAPVNSRAAISTLPAGQAKDRRFAVTVPENAAFTKPYFSRPTIEQPYYNVNDPRYLNLPNMPYPLTAWARFSYDGVPIRVGEVVQVVKRVTGEGTVLTPLAVAPAISVTLGEHAGIVPLGARQFKLDVTVHSNVKGAAEGNVQLQLPQGWTATPANASFNLAHDGQDLPLSFEVHPAQLAQQAYTVTAIANYGGKSYRQGYTVTGYEGVRPYYLYKAATYRTSGVNVKVAPGLNVAYVTGTGSNVPQALEDLGIHVHFLSSQDIATGNLSQYSAIVLGVRAYAARPELTTYNRRLLDYVENGGAVIVQYQSGEYDHNFGPYPLSLGRSPEKVMDEKSAVELLQPNNPVLSWPNKITPADFQGWIEERGHSFMTTWDPHYEALVEMHDPNQAPQKGGLLYARYGKGVYVYEGLALYRQFMEGVPGAYRIFANLVSVGRAPQP